MKCNMVSIVVVIWGPNPIKSRSMVFAWETSIMHDCFSVKTLMLRVWACKALSTFLKLPFKFSHFYLVDYLTRMWFTHHNKVGRSRAEDWPLLHTFHKRRLASVWICHYASLSPGEHNICSFSFCTESKKYIYMCSYTSYYFSKPLNSVSYLSYFYLKLY